MSNICYYSTRCKYCQAFLEELSRSPYSKEFRFVCVDPGPQRPPIPSNVKVVPTLIIAGEPEPRTDGSVMNWLSERRLMERQPIPSAGFGTPSAQTEPVGFEDSFGGGDYAYIGEDTNVTTATNVRLAGNMVGFNDLSPGNAPQAAPGPKMSAKAQALDNAFNAYQANRDKDLPKGPQRR